MKWKGNMQINGFSIPVSVSLKMLDEMLLGEWSGHGSIVDNAETRLWLLNNKGKVLDTDIGSIVITHEKATAKQLTIRFNCAGVPKGKLAEDIQFIK